MINRLNLRGVALGAVAAVLFASTGPGAVLAKASPAPPAASQASQPHMESALSYLHQALQELNAAAADKAGHRNQAISAVQTAINQVKAGMKSAP